MSRGHMSIPCAQEAVADAAKTLGMLGAFSHYQDPVILKRRHGHIQRGSAPQLAVELRGPNGLVDRVCISAGYCYSALFQKRGRTKTRTVLVRQNGELNQEALVRAIEAMAAAADAHVTESKRRTRRMYEEKERSLRRNAEEAQRSKDAAELRELAKWLAECYLSNAGTPHEFVTCITPGSKGSEFHRKWRRLWELTR